MNSGSGSDSAPWGSKTPSGATCVREVQHITQGSGRRVQHLGGFRLLHCESGLCQAH